MMIINDADIDGDADVDDVMQNTQYINIIK